MCGWCRFVGLVVDLSTTNHTTKSIILRRSRCLNESATPVRLEIVQIASPKGGRTHGESMFAPVGRGTPGHPDRGRQRHERQEDGPFAGTQPVQHQQGDQAQHVVPVQRERVLTAVPAEASEDGPVDGRMLHRRPRRGARPAAGAPDHAGATACHANACGRGWPNGRVAAGPRRRLRPDARACGFLLGSVGLSEMAVNAFAVVFGLLCMFTSGMALLPDMMPGPMIMVGKLLPGWWLCTSIDNAFGLGAVTRVDYGAWASSIGLVALFGVAFICLGLALERIRRTRPSPSSPAATQSAG